MSNSTRKTHFITSDGHLFAFFRTVYKSYTGRVIPVGMSGALTKQFNIKMRPIWDAWNVKSSVVKRGLIVYVFHANPLGLDDTAKYAQIENLQKAIKPYNDWLKQHVCKSGVAVDPTLINAATLWKALEDSSVSAQTTAGMEMHDELFEAFKEIA